MENVDAKTGAKTSRSETVGVRLDPKIRYLAELMAREERRTLSNLIEIAIIELLKNGPHLRNEGFWDIDPADRFVLLVGKPEWLTPAEQWRWKRIREDANLFDSRTGKIKRDSLRKQWTSIIANEEK